MKCRNGGCNWEGRVEELNNSPGDIDKTRLKYFCPKCSVEQILEHGVEKSEQAFKKVLNESSKKVVQDNDKDNYAYFKKLNKVEQIDLLNERGIIKIPRFEKGRIIMLMELMKDGI